MSHSTSLRTRLVRLTSVCLCIVLLGAFIGTAMVLNEREEELINEILNEHLQSLLSQYQHDAPVHMHVPGMQFYAFVPGQSSQADLPSYFARALPGSHEVDVGETEFHFVVRDENGRRFLLAYDVEKYEESFSELLWILGMAFLIAMVLSVMVIHLLGKRALANIERLADSVKNPPDGSFRHAGMEAEVAALAAALDDYRAQQSLLLQREQEFSAHLSHELRTPLSVVRAQAEIIRLRHGDDTALAARADTVMEQVDRMRQLIEQLLRLARSQRSPERREIRLRPLVERIWSELEQANQSATRLDDQLDVSALVLANPLLLELILRNVLANARLHANGSTLKVSCDGAVLVLEDYDPRLLEQPEVVAAHLPDEKMPGIGLSILERACRLLGWQCRIERLPTGTRVALTITD